MSEHPRDDSTHDAPHYDVVVVGAGLSGIGAAHRLQTERPGTSYAVLESREAIGGTWDLFRYPGVRSDSDMHTLGYRFRPWTDGKTLAVGGEILDYVLETARETGVREHVQLSSRVVGADFDTTSARWALTVEDPRTGARRTMTCGFLYACAGYYDYDTPHDPGFTGEIDGQVVHPQSWPRDLDLSGKRVVVIGSGATAVTLVPSLLRGDRPAAHVTMLQRSPTWIAPVPRRDALADRLDGLLPARVAHRVVRAKNVAYGAALYQLCRRRPQTARRVLTGMATRALGDPAVVAEHFTPTYDPWDQRLCAAPGADLFRAIASGAADVVTDHVDRFVPEGVLLRSGRVLPADVVVTATGLRLLALGGIEPHVDGVRVELSEQVAWNGAMVTGIPAFALCLGYTNASWTLRADLVHRLVCRVLDWQERRGYAAVVPVPTASMEHRPLLDLASGYVQRSLDAFPRQGDRGPWRLHQSYVRDRLLMLRTDLDASLAPVGPAVTVPCQSPPGGGARVAATA